MNILQIAFSSPSSTIIFLQLRHTQFLQYHKILPLFFLNFSINRKTVLNACYVMFISRVVLHISALLPFIEQCTSRHFIHSQTSSLRCLFSHRAILANKIFNFHWTFPKVLYVFLFFFYSSTSILLFSTFYSAVHDERHDTMEHPFLLKWHFATEKKARRGIRWK